MNLHAVVSPMIGGINPPVTGSLRISAGYSTAPDGSQTPAYQQIDGVSLQVQPVSGADLKQLDGLNIQGVERVVYLNGDLQGVQRFAAKGGDLLRFAGRVWLVTVVLETWGVGWCKVGVTAQKDAVWT